MTRLDAGVWCRACGSPSLAIVSTSNTLAGVRRTRRCRFCRTLRKTIEVDDGPTDKVNIRRPYPPDLARSKPRTR